MKSNRTTLIVIAAVLVIGALALASQWNTTISPGEQAKAADSVTDPALGSSSPQTPATFGAGYEVVAAESEALYRVREQLAGFSFPNDAVGRTQNVTGSVVFDSDGGIVADSSRIVVNLASLRSDQAMRDNYVSRNVLSTSQFPNAIFVPTAVKGLPFPFPNSGEAEVTIQGNMTIRNVTRPIEWTGTAEFHPDGLTVRAETMFTFADFSLTKPRVARVLSVEDDIRVETKIRFRSAETGV